MIHTLGYFMSNHMKDEIYDSCKSVVNPATSKPAITMMCGVWGDYCDAEKLFAFIGDISAYSPFQINYTFTDDAKIDKYEPLNKDLNTCAVPIPGKVLLKYLD